MKQAYKGMWYLIGILLLLITWLIVTAPMSHGEEGGKVILELNAEDWFAWSSERQWRFVEGFLSGYYVALQVSTSVGYLNLSESTKVYDILEQVPISNQIAHEVTKFYEQTHRYDWPIAVVILNRNLRGKLPNWEGYK